MTYNVFGGMLNLT